MLVNCLRERTGVLKRVFRVSLDTQVCTHTHACTPLNAVEP